LAKQGRAASATRREVSRREERARRILDAAATLILRWGYNKTTLDDIAREAGVAKGTMYLHWKTREDLFSALMKRERAEMAGEIMQRLAADPEGATLRSMFKHIALAMMKRPLLKALIVRDMDMLGKYAQSRQSNAAHVERQKSFENYLVSLRERGLVRTDISLQAQVYMLGAIFIGFFIMEPFMPDEAAFSDEEVADLMAETVHRALETGNALPSDRFQDTSHAFTQYMKHVMSNIQEDFQRELNSEHSEDEKPK
jgi:AcrR family transcriptional regulator